jgi:hypothetical protein
MRLSLSENGFGGPGLKLFDEVIEMTSEVSIPVKYAPLVPEEIGPRIIGCRWAGSGGERRRSSVTVYCGDAIDEEAI